MNEFKDWHAAYVACPGCQRRSTWCAPDPKPDARKGEREDFCLSCDGQFYRHERAFVNYTTYRALSEWHQERVRALRMRAGIQNSAVGAFG